jgi:2-amino-4-hydroxy-6-hydroxymethyldihydropteridine diphosphokinase
VLAAALARLEEDVTVLDAAPVLLTEPVGPSLRRYANSAAVIETKLDPLQLLHLVKGIEREFGRRQSGRRWTARVLDIDIVLWSRGSYAAPRLVVPHPLFRVRDFVLAPAAVIAAGWGDPVTGLTVRQLHARLTRPSAVRRAAGWSGP